jgi:predicted RNase H-like HicB family nuclease/predicted RNA binding protein YcfA (HicA-like mRNA interferase family)
LCKNTIMKRPFAASVWREGNWYVSQCPEVDVSSQGETEEEALANLKEALKLHFEPPQATRPPRLRTIEVEVGAARPLPFREVKRRLETAGFVETSQKGSHVKFVRRSETAVDTAIVQGNTKSQSALSEAS